MGEGVAAAAEGVEDDAEAAAVSTSGLDAVEEQGSAAGTGMGDAVTGGAPGVAPAVAADKGVIDVRPPLNPVSRPDRLDV